MKRGDPGVNELDKACKEHDISYLENSSGIARRKADDILATKAWQRFKSADSTLGEKSIALSVAGIMKAKSKIGLGLKKKKQAPKRKKTKKVKKTNMRNVLRNTIKSVKNELSFDKPISLEDASKTAFKAASAAVRNQKISKKEWNEESPRIIPVPKVGGFLPLIPIFAGLSALGTIMGGSGSITNAVIQAQKAKERLNEANRHNQMMEAIAIGKSKSGDGVYLKQYRKGLGIYLKHHNSKNL